MPTTLPVIDSCSTEPPPAPLPICIGLPNKLWVETLRTEEDVQDFWRGYAIGGAVCVVLFVVEIVVIIQLL